MSAFGEASAARSRGVAAEKIKEAEKVLKSWFSGSKHEDAAELYKQAGHQLKAAKDLEDAGAAYSQAAQYFEKAGQVGEAAMAYSDAATVLKTVAGSDAITAARHAIEIYRGQGRFSQAGRLTSMIAEMYEAAGEMEEAMANYQEAYEIHLSDNQPQKAHKWLEKVGDLALAQEDYSKAAEIYEAMGDFCLTETRLQQMNAKNWYLKAWMCYMVLDSVLGAEKGNAYLAKDHNLEEAREGELITGIISAVESLDEAAFTEAVGTYNRVARLAPEAVTMLLKIREPIEAEGAGAGAGAEEETPDLDALRVDAADEVLPVGDDGFPDLT